ncbi:MAG: hypothetical protein V1664_04685 [Candidatus Uhrbacteria bacterium]
MRRRWKKLIDFIKIKKDGIKIDELLSYLKNVKKTNSKTGLEPVFD